MSHHHNLRKLCDFVHEKALKKAKVVQLHDDRHQKSYDHYILGRFNVQEF